VSVTNNGIESASFDACNNLLGINFLTPDTIVDTIEEFFVNGQTDTLSFLTDKPGIFLRITLSSHGFVTTYHENGQKRYLFDVSGERLYSILCSMVNECNGGDASC
jgi:hypothetical protein